MVRVRKWAFVEGRLVTGSLDEHTILTGQGLEEDHIAQEKYHG